MPVMNIRISKGSSLQIWQQSENLQCSRLCSSDPWPFEPKISRLWQIIEDYYFAKFQVILITGLSFIMLTCTPTYTPWQSDRNIRTNTTLCHWRG